VASGGLAALGGATMTLLGDASYGLYLLQMPLFSAIAGKYEWSLAKMLGFFALLVAASIVTHFAVEKPAQRALARY
jgi:peptidoglycan/LPS O-acetylase OafA/YrhL